MTDIEKPDVIGATRRAETIRNGMIGYAAAMEAIGEAFEARDWVALGYKDWDTYCEKEFSEKRLKLTREQREQAVLAFRGAGMSTRAIAAALGVNDRTVRNDLSGADFSAPESVIGADGKTYAANKPPAQNAPAGRDPETSPEVPEIATTGQPEEDHPAPPPGDAAQDEVLVVPTNSSGDETEVEDAALQQSSAPVEERQQEETGVAPPAAAPQRSGRDEEQERAAASVPAPPGDPDKVRRNEALTKWAQDTPEHRTAARRRQFFAFLEAGEKFLDAVGADELAPDITDDELRDAAAFGDAFGTWLTALEAIRKQNGRLRLVKEA